MVKVLGQTQNSGGPGGLGFTRLLKDTSEGWMHSVTRAWTLRPSGWRTVRRITTQIIRTHFAQRHPSKPKAPIARTSIIKYKLWGNRHKEAANWVYNYQNTEGRKVVHQSTNKHVTSGFLRTYLRDDSFYLPWKWRPPHSAGGGEPLRSYSNWLYEQKTVLGWAIRGEHDFKVLRDSAERRTTWLFPSFFTLL